MRKENQIYFLALLILLLIVLNYDFLDNFLVKEFGSLDNSVKVKRVIDGDTFVLENNVTVRLFGINTPEKGEKYYSEAKEFLDNLVLNKSVKIESFGKDKYYRELGMIFFGKENINLKMVEEGFANVYILDEKKYEEELRKSWKVCLEKEKNLCEKSLDKCAECVKLKEIIGQEIILENVCDFSCDLNNWEIKDEGRKKFIFPEFILEKEVKIIVGEGENSDRELFWKGEEYVWTKTGDTIFLRDDEGKLVFWKYL